MGRRRGALHPWRRLFVGLSTEIRYHHTRWEELLKAPSDHRLRLRANLLFLADRINVVQAPFLNSGLVLTKYPALIEQIKTLAGVLFAPELVDSLAILFHACS